MPAIVASQTGNMVVQSHAVADTKTSAGSRPADFDNHAGRLMAENARRGDNAVVDLLDVGRADTANSDFDEKFTGLNTGDGDGFKAKVVSAAIDDGLHCFWNSQVHSDRLAAGSLFRHEISLDRFSTTC
jgi:hypothetical protein